MAAAGTRYARALLDCAATPEQADTLESALGELQNALNIPEAQAFFGNPTVPGEAKKKAMNSILADTEPLLRSFSLLLIDKRRLDMLCAIAAEYERLKRELRGVLHIEVSSAAPLGPEQLDGIRDRFLKQYGATAAIVDETVDPSLLGGVLVQIGDTRVDDTLKARLARLYETMKSGE